MPLSICKHVYCAITQQRLPTYVTTQPPDKNNPSHLASAKTYPGSLSPCRTNLISQLVIGFNQMNQMRCPGAVTRMPSAVSHNLNCLRNDCFSLNSG